MQITKLKNKKNTGFTLIEMLVVVSIIGVLVALVSPGLINAQKSGRDAKRRNDMNAYRGALELWANGNGGLYPLSASAQDLLLKGDGTYTCASLGSPTPLSPTYMGGCPVDPKSGISGQTEYKYQSDATAVNYCVWASLETVTGSCYKVCSDGKAGDYLVSSCPGSIP